MHWNQWILRDDFLFKQIAFVYVYDLILNVNKSNYLKV